MLSVAAAGAAVAPRRNVLTQILDHAERTPRHPATKDLDQDLDYGELGRQAGLMAAALAERGVGRASRVALFLPNSVDFIVAALATMWVGATFIPLALTDPEVRLAAILDDCRPALVVTSRPGPDAQPVPAALARFSVVSAADLVPGVAAPPPVDEHADDAYIIFTSGTTGAPKGVVIGHRAFAVAIGATSSALGFDSATRALCVSPFHFDGSFGTLFPALCAGAAVILRPREALLFPRTFFNAVAQESITMTGFSPSYLRLLESSPQLTKLAGSTLELVALGGEACGVGELRLLWEAAPQVRVFNRYGPTETTIAVTHIELTPALVADGVIPIGRPHPGVSFYLWRHGELVEGPDQIGELYIGGTQLMNGYWGAPELTAQVMRRDVVPGQTVYRTGDLMYRDHAGSYVYVDRADRVVKRSGVRISLLELGNALATLPGVSAAACVVFDDEGQLGIAAFVVAPGSLSSSDIHRAARRVLPDTMIPDHIELVASLPLTASNKLDERRLLAEAHLGQRAGAAGPAQS